MANLAKNGGVPNSDTWMAGDERHQAHSVPSWAALFEEDKNFLASTKKDSVEALSPAGEAKPNSEQTRDERVARKLTVRAAA